MRVEYTPTVEDVYRLKRALYRRARRQPLVAVMALGMTLVAVGGAIMATAGSPVWLSVTALGLTGLAVLALAMKKLTVRREQVEKEYAGRSWVRRAFGVEVDENGLTYAHGPFHSRVGWAAFETVVETDHHLILLEKPGPGALAYGLSKRALDAGEGVPAWRDFLTRHLRAA